MKKKNTTQKINTIDLLIKSAPPARLNFRTGRFITEKDRPRKKNWKKWEHD